MTFLPVSRRVRGIQENRDADGILWELKGTVQNCLAVYIIFKN